MTVSDCQRLPKILLPTAEDCDKHWQSLTTIYLCCEGLPGTASDIHSRSQHLPVLWSTVKDCEWHWQSFPTLTCVVSDWQWLRQPLTVIPNPHVDCGRLSLTATNTRSHLQRSPVLWVTVTDCNKHPQSFTTVTCTQMYYQRLISMKPSEIQEFK